MQFKPLHFLLLGVLCCVWLAGFIFYVKGDSSASRLKVIRIREEVLTVEQ